MEYRDFLYLSGDVSLSVQKSVSEVEEESPVESTVTIYRSRMYFWNLRFWVSRKLPEWDTLPRALPKNIAISEWIK